MKKNREQFKRLFRLFLTGVLVLSQTLIFAHIWLNYYNDNIVLPFVQKGNWFIYALYALLLITFLHSFDGIKYGRYRKSNVIISHCLAILFTVFFSYLIIVLLSASFVTVLPLLVMTVISVAVSFVFAIIGDYIFGKVFPAKKTLIIYDEYSPEVFIEKLKHRKDKYALKQVINVSEGIDKLEEAIKASEGVILYDIHAEMRNKLLKICFENNIRAYTTTKISDVLIRGAECIHLFDTPLLLYRNNGMTVEQRIVKRGGQLAYPAADAF